MVDKVGLAWGIILRKLIKWIGRLRSHLPSVILLSISLGLLGVGFVLFNNSISSYEVASRSATGIIVGHHPYHFWEITSFMLTIDPTANTLDLELWFDYEREGNYSIALTLPYRIESNSTLRFTPDEVSWTWRNAESGSVVMVTFTAEVDPQNGMGSQIVSQRLHLKDPIADKIFEVHSINLPFAGSFTLDVKKEWDNLRSIAPIAPVRRNPNCSLSLLLPTSAAVITTTDHIAGSDPALETQKLLKFQLASDSLFFIQYSVPEERYIRETNLFLGGIFIAAAFSGLISVLGDLLKFTLKRGRVAQSPS